MSDQVLNERAVITLESGQFEANSKKVVAALQQIQSAANAAKVGLGGAGNSASTATTQIAGLNRGVAVHRGGMQTLNSSLNSTRAGMTGLANANSRLSGATRANTTATNANSTSLKSNTSAITGLNTHVNALQASVDQLSAHMAAAAANTRQVGAAAGAATLGFGALGGVLAGLSFGVLAKEAIELTDAYRSLQTRLTVTTAGIASSGGAMADVSRIARDTRANLDDIGLLYAKVANAGKNFGATQTQVARVTETVSKGLRVFGASAAETSSVITQLGQALASGRLQGDEFRSMTENAPALMDILAESTGKPRAELKKLGTDGKLTSDIIVKAFGDMSPALKKLDSDFTKLPTTVSESFTLVKNSIEETLGTSEKMVGTTRVLAAGLQGLASNMDTVLPLVGLLSTAIGVNMVRSMIAARIAAGGLGTALKGALLSGAISLGITALVGGLATLATQVYESNNAINSLANASAKAKTETSLTGVEALVAARGVASFGGQAGAAAGKLWDMARAARAAAIETAKLNFQKASATFHETNALTNRGFVNQQGQNNAQLTDPNASFGERVGALGSSVVLGAKKLFAPRQEKVTAARDQAFQNLQGSYKNLQDAVGGSMESYIPKVDPVSSGGKPKKKPKEKADKSEPVGDFWKGLETSKTLASETGVNLEFMTKQFELQKALGREVNDGERLRLSTLLAQTREAKLLTDMLDKTVDLRSTNGLAELQLWEKAKGATDEQLSVESSLYEYRARAIKEQINTESELYKSRESEYRKELERAGNLKSIQRGLDYAATVSPELANRNKTTELTNRRNDLDAAYDSPNSTLSERDYKLGKRAIENDQRALANAWGTQMGEQISSVADLFGEAMGSKIDKLGKLMDAITKAASGDLSGFTGIGKLAGMFTKNRDGTNNALGNQVSDAMNNTLGSIGRTLGIGNRKTDKLTAASDSTAASSEEIVVQGKRLPGDLATAVAGALVGAGIGGALGGTAGSLGGALGGAAMTQFAGKALGAFAGPLGGIIGGIGGSLIGGLFKKKKEGSSTLMIGDDGVAYGSDAVGKGSSAKKAADQLSSSLAGQLNSLAETLGGSLGSANVSIGYRPGHKAPAYRVDTSGGGKVTGVEAFETEAEAIAFALKDAIKDGVLVGLSDFAQKAVNALDVDAAVALVGAYKSITDELDAMGDPIGASVRSLNSDLDSLVKQMTKVGASGTDLAKVEEYRSKKLAEIIEQNLSSLNDFKKVLNGEGSGVTVNDRFLAAQSVYQGFKKDILAGKTVDQEKFTAAGNDVNALAASMYGTSTSQYQLVRSDLTATTNALVDLITNSVNGAAGVAANVTPIDPVAAQITDQTNVLAQIGTTSNDLLAQQNALIRQLIAQNDNGGAGGASSKNGRIALV